MHDSVLYEEDSDVSSVSSSVAQRRQMLVIICDICQIDTGTKHRRRRVASNREIRGDVQHRSGVSLELMVPM